MPKNPFDLTIKNPTLNPLNFGKTTKKVNDSRGKFIKSQEKEIWAIQDGICASFNNTLDPRSTEYDHIKPWSEGGKTEVKNGRALCANCHKKITHKNTLKKHDVKKSNKNSNSLFETNIFGSKSNPWKF